jgi:hypothetical protein
MISAFSFACAYDRLEDFQQSKMSVVEPSASLSKSRVDRPSWKTRGYIGTNRNGRKNERRVVEGHFRTST